MKKTTCKALAGACDTEIFGKTPEEMGENSKKHAMEINDDAHREAMQKMMTMSQEEQQKWYEDFKNNFDSLEEA